MVKDRTIIHSAKEYDEFLGVEEQMTEEKTDYPLNFYQAIEAAMDGAVVEDIYGVTISRQENRLVWENTSGAVVTKRATALGYRIHTPAPNPKVKRAQYMVYQEGSLPRPLPHMYKDDQEFKEHNPTVTDFERIESTEVECKE